MDQVHRLGDAQADLVVGRLVCLTISPGQSSDMAGGDAKDSDETVIKDTYSNLIGSKFIWMMVGVIRLRHISIEDL